LADASEKLITSIIRVMSSLVKEVLRSAETLLSIHQSKWRNMPEDGHIFKFLLPVNLITLLFHVMNI
jgi:hypothetical protein